MARPNSIGTGGRQLYNFADAPLPVACRDNHTFGARLFTLGNGQWSADLPGDPWAGLYRQRQRACHTAWGDTKNRPL
jgi:hypothetical protein